MIADFVIAPQGRHCHCHNISKVNAEFFNYDDTTVETTRAHSLRR